MRNWINLVEAMGNDFVSLAQKCQTVDEFIRRTDGMDALYRGHSGGPVENNSFFTDYVGHAGEYGDTIDAYGFDFHDVFFFNNEHFDEMRNAYRALSPKAFTTLYRASLVGNRFALEYENALPAVRSFIRSTEPYSTICSNYPDNDKLIPLMQYYALTARGCNIIGFLGGDYGDYGGQNEYVVGDISRLTNLRQLYASVHHIA